MFVNSVKVDNIYFFIIAQSRAWCLESFSQIILCVW